MACGTRSRVKIKCHLVTIQSYILKIQNLLKLMDSATIPMYSRVGFMSSCQSLYQATSRVLLTVCMGDGGWRREAWLRDEQPS